ncbi:MAG: hypothetical protein CSA86_04500 [Arcobacter sp.]|nr:MAG: hypothetical protein CSA86_04500 [Arcobacter sp.]
MINIDSSIIGQNPYLNNSLASGSSSKNLPKNDDSKQESKDIKKSIEDSAVRVTLSMNAQIVLFSMDARQLNSENIAGQKSIFEFLSGNETEDGLSLKNIGYEGKPITELSVEEANDLLSEDGFFGVKQTSKRVSDFVLNFSDDDVEILKKGREGIVKGFEEAEKLWGGKLPDISYETQAKTLEIIDAKIAKLEGNIEETVEEEN